MLINILMAHKKHMQCLINGDGNTSCFYSKWYECISQYCTVRNTEFPVYLTEHGCTLCLIYKNNAPEEQRCVLQCFFFCLFDMECYRKENPPFKNLCYFYCSNYIITNNYYYNILLWNTFVQHYCHYRKLQCNTNHILA